VCATGWLHTGDLAEIDATDTPTSRTKERDDRLVKWQEGLSVANRELFKTEPL